MITHIFSGATRVYCELSESRYKPYIGKGKSVPLQAWSGLEGSRKLRYPDFKTTAQGSGKVVSLTHRLPLPAGNALRTRFC